MLHDLDAPGMYQVGSLDPFFTFAVSGFGGAYARSPAPKYYVEIAGADHFAWTDGARPRNHAIVDYAMAFLDCYVRLRRRARCCRRGGRVSPRNNETSDASDPSGASRRALVRPFRFRALALSRMSTNSRRLA
ncbi:MAG TPA: hypothetical protein VN989_07900 [Casimicrobiaceae bacterium]|nr:hypothetical protein [Casimicrobiaceae bacterium]